MVGNRLASLPCLVYIRRNTPSYKGLAYNFPLVDDLVLFPLSSYLKIYLAYVTNSRSNEELFLS